MNTEDDQSEKLATNEKSKEIRVINKDTVHKICSGQVVLNLAIAVKELVENSIDAGATIVEIKLREQCSELIEVVDNGSGVEEKNFAGLTAKYHTSKIESFSDVADVSTFGFRGEALSSLCALSDMVIITRHLSADHATKLELDHHGVIKKRSATARQVGTSVQLTNLFATLPVRKRELSKNLKREFVKLCQILQAYCLVSVGVRIICTNQNQKGVKTTFMSTSGAKTVLENITAIFGNKQTKELVELKSIDPVENVEKSVDISEIDENKIDLNKDDPAIENLNLSGYKLEGWISSCSHGSGRSAKDRQFIYVNSRPCEPKAILKLINESYHRYNVSQHPFVYLNIKMERASVDVNVTPDKRQILVNNEKFLLLAVKRALINSFGAIPQTFKHQNLDISKSFTSSPSTEEKPMAKSMNDSKDIFNTDADDNDDCILSTQPNPKLFGSMLSQWRLTGKTDEPCKKFDKSNKRKLTDEISVRTAKLQRVQEILSDSSKNMSYLSDSDSENDLKHSLSNDKSSNKDFKITVITPTTSTSSLDSCIARHDMNILTPELSDNQFNVIEEEFIQQIDCKVPSVANSETTLQFELFRQEKKDNIMNSPQKEKVISPLTLFEDEDTSESVIVIEPCVDTIEIFSQEPNNIQKEVNKIEPDIRNRLSKASITDSDSDDSPVKVDAAPIEIDSSIARDDTDDVVKLSTTIEDIESKIKLEQKCKTEIAQRKVNLDRLKFHAPINPTKNKIAEKELATEITKDMFAKMEIIGQFNLGFIIVKLDDDLFIIDQHATDEKYNFEMLQKNTTLEHQKLVVPQRLELTAINELILIDNLNIFEMNGFSFEIDENEPPTRKVKLTGKPYSKNWEFGKEDIDELIFMLEDAPNTICRPSRVRTMFASRACRKSVMIGKPLSKALMQRLVTHMGEIEQPWNCPHGRPTMRHLINLQMLEDVETST